MHMKRIAHRGASGYETENTLKAFKKAINMDCDMIELDVRMCATGEIVVCHDARIDRITNGQGLVKDMTLSEIQQYHCENKEPIPTLEQALSAIEKKIIININTKDAASLLPVATIIETYVTQKGWSYKHFIISSSKIFRLRHLKELHPNIQISPIIVFGALFWLRFLGNIRPHALQVYWRVVNDHLVHELKKRKINLYVWTVNDKEKIEKFKHMKIDGIITDYPDRI